MFTMVSFFRWYCVLVFCLYGTKVLAATSSYSHIVVEDHPREPTELIESYVQCEETKAGRSTYFENCKHIQNFADGIGWAEREFLMPAHLVQDNLDQFCLDHGFDYFQPQEVEGSRTRTHRLWVTSGQRGGRSNENEEDLFDGLWSFFGGDSGNEGSNFDFDLPENEYDSVVLMGPGLEPGVLFGHQYLGRYGHQPLVSVNSIHCSNAPSTVATPPDHTSEAVQRQRRESDRERFSQIPSTAPLSSSSSESSSEPGSPNYANGTGNVLSGEDGFLASDPFANP